MFSLNLQSQETELADPFGLKTVSNVRENKKNDDLKSDSFSFSSLAIANVWRLIEHTIEMVSILFLLIR